MIQTFTRRGNMIYEFPAQDTSKRRLEDYLRKTLEKNKNTLPNKIEMSRVIGKLVEAYIASGNEPTFSIVTTLLKSTNLPDRVEAVVRQIKDPGNQQVKKAVVAHAIKDINYKHTFTLNYEGSNCIKYSKEII